MGSIALKEMVEAIFPPGPDAYCCPPFINAHSALDQLDFDGPKGLCKNILRDDLAWLSRLLRGVEAVSARWLAELDRQEHEGPPDRSSNCSLWLQEELHLTSNAAYSQIRIARLLEQQARTYAALRQGKINWQQVSVICRAMEEVTKTRLNPAEVELDLLDAARSMDALNLLRFWQQMRYQADQEAGLEAEEEQHRRRWLRLSQTWKGSYRLEGELDPEGGTTLKTALQGLMKTQPKDDKRTPDQGRADAAVEMARCCLEAGALPEQGGEKPHLMLISELSTLRLEPGSRLAELDWGPLVTGESARRIACDAAITPVIVDSDGEVLYVGNSSRSLPTRLHKALKLRDRHCQTPGCPMPADRCQAHHIRHWADGGPTELSNIKLYCTYHHTLLHPENARYRTGAGIQQQAP